MVVATKPTARGTGLDALRQAGSLKCVFPRPVAKGIDAVLVNTAGGITGGDRFDVTATAGSGTALTLTTQAAERAYQASPGQQGLLQTGLTVEAGARLHWLPQETLLFQGCDLNRRLTADLAPDARLLLCEPVIFGRAAMGEVLTGARFRDRIEVRQDGKPLYLDAMTLSGDIAAHLSGKAIAGKAGAMASLVYVAPDAETRLTALRKLLPPSGGVSQPGPNHLVMRLLAPDGYALRKHLIPILTTLSRSVLPRCWMI